MSIYACPCLLYWQPVKRILRYLKHIVDYGLHIIASSSPTLANFTDADQVGCLDDRKSTGSCYIFYGNNLICWSSKKQSSIARSNTEAEYKALAHATCELLWVQTLLSKLWLFLSKPSTLYYFTMITWEQLTYLLIPSFILVQNMLIQIITLSGIEFRPKLSKYLFLSSEDQLADIFIKPLSSSRFNTLRSSLTIMPLLSGSRGHIR